MKYIDEYRDPVLARRLIEQIATRSTRPVQLMEFCGPERTACVAREISKLHEEITTAPLAELKTYYEAKGKVKGEIVVVVAGV